MMIDAAMDNQINLRDPIQLDTNPEFINIIREEEAKETFCAVNEEDFDQY